MDIKSTIIGTVLLGTAVTGVVTDARVNPYDDKGTYLEVKANEQTIEISKEKPEITLKKWNDEESISIAYEDVKTSGDRGMFSDKVEWKDGKEEVHAYPVEGGFEIEVVLNEAPASNVFDFKLTGWEDLDFIYTPELTEKEKALGINQDENTIGSYAVYHKTKKNHVLGETNYGNGKLYHIYRPKIIDANDAWVWGTLEYEDGVLTVIVPTDFLATATYPVKVDPTIGNTNIGAFNAATPAMICSVYSTTESSPVTSMTMYANQDAGNTVAGAIYSDNATFPNALVAQDTGNTSGTGSAAWLTVNISTTLTGSTPYWLCTWGSDSRTIYWDTGTANQYTNEAGVSTFESWPNPFPTVGPVQFARALSVYVTYTSAGGSAPLINIVNFE